MGSAAAMVRRQHGNVRPVVSGRSSMAGGGRKPTALEGDGCGHDLFYTNKFLLFGWIVRRLVASMDLDEYRTGFARQEASRWAEDIQRSSGIVETGACADGELSSTSRVAGFATGCTVLLPVAGASSCRSLVELGRTPQQVRPGALRGAESLRLVR